MDSMPQVSSGLDGCISSDSNCEMNLTETKTLKGRPLDYDLEENKINNSLAEDIGYNVQTEGSVEELIANISYRNDDESSGITESLLCTSNCPASLLDPEILNTVNNKKMDIKSLSTDVHSMENASVDELKKFVTPETSTVNEDPIRPKSSVDEKNFKVDESLQCSSNPECIVETSLIPNVNHENNETEEQDVEMILDISSNDCTIDDDIPFDNSSIDDDCLVITESLQHSSNYHQISLPDLETLKSVNNQTIGIKSLTEIISKPMENPSVDKLVILRTENSSVIEDSIQSAVDEVNVEVEECPSDFQTSIFEPEILITSDNNIYRQQEEICLTSDSEDDSSSSLSNANVSSSDESEDEPKEVEVIKLPNKKKNKKKNKDSLGDEIELPPIEDLQISIKEEEAKVIGSIYQIVDNQVVVQAYPDIPPIDIDSILFLDCGKRALGKVFDVFGNVQEPLYVVRFNSAEHMNEKGIEKGIMVYFAPQHNQHTSYVIMEQLLREKGSDASWKDNREPPPELIEYSDDEEERNKKQRRKQRKMIPKDNMDTSVSLWIKPEPDSNAPKMRTNSYSNNSRPQHSGQFDRPQNFQNRPTHTRPRHGTQGMFRGQPRYNSRPNNRFTFGGPPQFISPSPSPFSMPPPSPFRERAPPSQSPNFNISVLNSTPGPTQSWMGRNSPSYICTPPPPSPCSSPFWENNTSSQQHNVMCRPQNDQPTPMSHSGQSSFGHNRQDLVSLSHRNSPHSPGIFSSGPTPPPSASHCFQSYTSVQQNVHMPGAVQNHTSRPPPTMYESDPFPQSRLTEPPPQSHMHGPRPQSHMSGPPPPSHMSGPPPPSHMSGPPPPSHMSGPPPPSHMSGPPPPSHMSGPPPQSHMSGPPPPSHMSKPPPQSHMSGPPPQLHMSVPPPQSHMSLPPPQSLMPGPPLQSHLSRQSPQPQMLGPPSQTHMQTPFVLRPESHVYRDGGLPRDTPFLRSPPNHAPFSQIHQQQNTFNGPPIDRQRYDPHSSANNTFRF